MSGRWSVCVEISGAVPASNSLYKELLKTQFVAQSMPWSFGLLATLVQQVGCPQKNQHVLGGYVRAPKTLKPVVLLHISKCYKPRMISWRCGLLEHKF